MSKIYDETITDKTDWGGDSSTGNLPVSGRRVQEYIKNKLTTLKQNDADNVKALEQEVIDRNKAISQAVAQEASIRETAITEEIKNRDKAISAAFALEASNRQDAIDAEASNRSRAIASAITQEVEDRNAAIEEAVKTERTNRTTAISDEVTAREEADTALSKRLNVVENRDIFLSSSEYEHLDEKDPDKLYFVYED